MATKKLALRLVAVVLVLVSVLSLVGCGTSLKGTYVPADTSIVDGSITFEDGNQIVVSALGLDIKGTYVIEDDKLIVTYSLLAFSTDLEWNFNKKGNSIFIDGTEFVKEK